MELAVIDGKTAIVTVIQRFYPTDSDVEKAIVRVEVDSEGNRIISQNNNENSQDNNNKEINVSDIVSFNPITQVTQYVIAYFSNVKDQYLLKACNYITANDLANPKGHHHSHHLGSGIYGMYFEERELADEYRSNADQTIFWLPVYNPLTVQDEYHGKSISYASQRTNKYINTIVKEINALRLPIKGAVSIWESDQGQDQTQNQDQGITALVNLWLMVFYRVGNVGGVGGNSNDIKNFPLRRDKLIELLDGYVTMILTPLPKNMRSNIGATIIDSRTGGQVFEAPINVIMRVMGYDSLLADDDFNNSFSRGCVFYNHYSAQIITSQSCY